MSKRYDKYKYNNNEYLYVELCAEQQKDECIVEYAKLIKYESGDYCIFLKDFFDQNFVKVEYTRSEKIIKKFNKMMNVILSGGLSGLLLASITIGIFFDIQHTNKIASLLKEKNVCESVQNVILKK